MTTFRQEMKGVLNVYSPEESQQQKFSVFQDRRSNCAVPHLWFRAFGLIKTQQQAIPVL